MMMHTLKFDIYRQWITTINKRHWYFLEKLKVTKRSILCDLFVIKLVNFCSQYENSQNVFNRFIVLEIYMDQSMDFVICLKKRKRFVNFPISLFGRNYQLSNEFLCLSLFRILVECYFTCFHPNEIRTAILN